MGNHTHRALLETNLKFAHPIDIDQISIYVDPVHTTGLKKCRSIGGHVAILAGSAIEYRGKWQKTVSTTSTEAEFNDRTCGIKVHEHCW
eukprot:12492499-Ditylum_brightwellii.AAC.1